MTIRTATLVLNAQPSRLLKIQRTKLLRTPTRSTTAGHLAPARGDFRWVNGGVPRFGNFRGSITSALAYGLLTRSPCAWPLELLPPAQGSLPGGWPALPGRASHPQELATLPGRTDPNYH